jgi:hypothetical protein
MEKEQTKQEKSWQLSHLPAGRGRRGQQFSTRTTGERGEREKQGERERRA